MKITVLVEWVRDNLADPVSKQPSNTRTLATLLILAAVVFAFWHPSNVETLVALLAAGTGNVALRARAQP